jgi:hypothetical protein
LADERLRVLQRLAQETGSLGDRARYWVEAVRVGVLDARRLELAAHLGDPAARVALGASHEDVAAPDDPGAVPRGEDVRGPDGMSAFYIPSQEASGVEEWGAATAGWGAQVAARTCIAAARLVLPIWEHGSRLGAGEGALEGPARGTPEPRRAIEAAEAWVLEPSPAHRAATQVARDALGVVLERTQYPWAHAALYAADHAARVDPPADDPWAHPTERGLRSAAESRTYDLIRRADERPSAANWDRHFVIAALELRAAIRADLVPWVLLEGDPLRERVAKWHGSSQRGG